MNAEGNSFIWLKLKYKLYQSLVINMITFI
jgi:hypothetical protein